MLIQPEAFWGAAKDLGQLFENNSNCYADTWDDSSVVMAMTKARFIEVVTKLIKRHKEKEEE